MSGRRCLYCGSTKRARHRDHIVPKSRGGVSLPINQADSCWSCNLSKGSKLPSEWRSDLPPEALARERLAIRAHPVILPYKPGQPKDVWADEIDRWRNSDAPPSPEDVAAFRAAVFAEVRRQANEEQKQILREDAAPPPPLVDLPAILPPLTSRQEAWLRAIQDGAGGSSIAPSTEPSPYVAESPIVGDVGKAQLFQAMGCRPRTGRGVTVRQGEVLRFIGSFLSERSYPPTLREIGAALFISSTNGVNDHIVALERRGLLERSAKMARSLRLTDRGVALVRRIEGEASLREAVG